MKKAILFALVIFSVSNCGIENQVQKTGSNSWASEQRFPVPDISHIPVEYASLTPVQSALLEGGPLVKLEAEGIVFKLPPGWTGYGDFQNGKGFYSDDSSRNTLLIHIRKLEERKSSVEYELAFEYQTKTVYQKNQYKNLRLVEVNGVKGFEVQENKVSETSRPDHKALRWNGVRSFKGQIEMISVLLTSDDFARHQNTLYAILYSIQFVNN